MPKRLPGKIIPYEAFLKKRNVQPGRNRKIERPRVFDAKWRLDRILTRHPTLQALKKRQRELLDMGIKPVTRRLREIQRLNTIWIEKKFKEELGIKIKLSEAGKKARDTSEYRDTQLIETEEIAEFLLTTAEIEKREGRLSEAASYRLRGIQALEDLQKQVEEFNRIQLGEETGLTEEERIERIGRIIPIKEAQKEPYRTFRILFNRFPTLGEQEKQLNRLANGLSVYRNELKYAKRAVEEIRKRRWGEKETDAIFAVAGRIKLIIAMLEAEYYSMRYVRVKTAGQHNPELLDKAKEKIEAMHKIIEEASKE